MSEPQPPVPQPPVPEPRPTLRSDLLSTERLLVFVVVFAIELAIFILGLVTPIDPATKQTIANETSSQFGGLQNEASYQVAIFIFSHNLEIALVELIPILGGAFFLISVYATGLATQVLVSASGLPGIYGLVLFALPYSFIELSAYAVAAGAGTMLILAVRRKRLKRELRVFAAEAVVVAVILIVAAVMETLTIELIQAYSLAGGLILWVPTLAMVAGLVVAITRGRK
jgi:uncharacterized membrane protein SpoIIM required for sporulation